MSSNKVASSLKSSAPLPKLLDDNVDEQLVKGKPFNRAAAARCPPAPDLLLVFDQTRDSVQMHVQAASSTAASSPSVHVSSSLVRISLPAAASGNDCSRAPLELQFALSARVARTSDYLVSHTPTTPGLGEAVFTLPKSEHEPWGAVEDGIQVNLDSPDEPRQQSVSEQEEGSGVVLVTPVRGVVEPRVRRAIENGTLASGTASPVGSDHSNGNGARAHPSNGYNTDDTANANANGLLSASSSATISAIPELHTETHSETQYQSRPANSASKSPPSCSTRPHDPSQPELHNTVRDTGTNTNTETCRALSSESSATSGECTSTLPQASPHEAVSREEEGASAASSTSNSAPELLERDRELRERENLRANSHTDPQAPASPAAESPVFVSVSVSVCTHANGNESGNGSGNVTSNDSSNGNDSGNVISNGSSNGNDSGNGTGSGNDSGNVISNGSSNGNDSGNGTGNGNDSGNVTSHDSGNVTSNGSSNGNYSGNGTGNSNDSGNVTSNDCGNSTVNGKESPTGNDAYSSSSRGGGAGDGDGDRLVPAPEPLSSASSSGSSSAPESLTSTSSSAISESQLLDPPAAGSPIVALDQLPPQAQAEAEAVRAPTPPINTNSNTNAIESTYTGSSSAAAAKTTSEVSSAVAHAGPATESPETNAPVEQVPSANANAIATADDSSSSGPRDPVERSATAFGYSRASTEQDGDSYDSVRALADTAHASGSNSNSNGSTSTPMDTGIASPPPAADPNLPPPLERCFHLTFNDYSPPGENFTQDKQSITITFYNIAPIAIRVFLSAKHLALYFNTKSDVLASGSSVKISGTKYLVTCRKAMSQGCDFLWPKISLESSPMPAAESFTLIHSSGELELGPLPTAIPCPPPPRTLPPLPANTTRSSSLKTPSSVGGSGSGSGSSSREDELQEQRNKLRRVDQSAAPVNGLDYSGYSHAAESSDVLEPFDSLGPGRRGLINSGSTCYANSVFQVLANTAPLLNAFLLHVPEVSNHKSASNHKSKGKVALSFQMLMHNLWSSSKVTSSYRPTPQLELFFEHKRDFVYGQQDAHEFLLAFLDLIHEDLNRKSTAPITSQSNDSTTDSERSWASHIARNLSPISELFHGQLRSIIHCSHCFSESKAYDPFTAISVPIALPPSQWPTLPVILLRGFSPMKCLNIPYNNNPDSSDGTLTPLLLHVALESRIPLSHLRVLIQSSNRARLFQADTNLNCLSRDYDEKSDRLIACDVSTFEETTLDICVSQFTTAPFVEPLRCSNPSCRNLEIKDLIACPDCSRTRYCSTDCYVAHKGEGHSPELSPIQVGLPFVLAISRTTTTGELVDMLLSFALQTLEFSVCSNFTQQSERRIVDKEFLRQNIRHLCTLSLRDNDIPLDLESESLVEQIFESSTSSYRHESSIETNLTWRNLKHKDLPAPLDCFRVGELAVPSNEAAGEPPAPRSSYMQQEFSLDDCLAAFFSRETLGTSEMWQCPRCAKPRVASKQLSLVRLPSCLIVHLKRFRTHGYYRSKIEDPVRFPLKLRLDSRFLVEHESQSSALFDLYGIVNHSGSLSFGHYTSFARLMLGADAKQSPVVLRDWRRFDDSYVERCDERDDIPADSSSRAYLLFYMRRDCLPQPLAEPLAQLTIAQQAHSNISN